MKYHFIILALVVAGLLSHGSLSAATFEVDGIYYNNVWGSETEVEVTALWGQPYEFEVLSIPATINYEGKTYNVTRINRITEEENPYIKEVTIPNSVKEILGRAFAECTALTSIDIPNSVTLIGSSVFEGCTALKNITIGNGVSSLYYYGSVLSGCPAVETITIGSGVMEISGDMFCEMPVLKSIAIDNDNESYKDVDGKVYSKDGSKLIAVPAATISYTMPDDVTDIDNFAFSGPTLQTVNYGAGITDLSESGFGSRCESMRTITFGDGVEYFRYDRYCLPNVTSIVVSEGNTTYRSIEGALYTKDGETLLCCPSGKESYTSPLGVKHIGESAFSECKSLKNAVLCSDIEDIGDYAFSNCSSLIAFTFPNSVTETGSSIFAGCNALASVILGDGMTSCYSMFGSCPNLASLTLGAGITDLHNGIFTETNYYGSENYSVTTVTCPKLSNLYVSEANPIYKSVDGVLFSKDGKTLMLCPLGRKEYVIPTEVNSIGDGAFEYCESLLEITIPDNVSSIGNVAFSGCNSLHEINIPDNVSTIGDGVFAGSGIKSVSIGKGFIPEEDGILAGIFSGCYLDSIHISGENSKFSSYEGVAYTKDMSTLLVFPAGRKVADNIYKTITAIGLASFAGCNCETITLPTNVKTIGDGAFEFSGNLKELTINENIKSIGRLAFNGCDKLTEFHCYAQNPPEVICTGYYWEDTFGNFNQVACALHVPTGSGELYKEANGWKDFFSIVEEDVSGIGSVVIEKSTRDTIYNLFGHKLSAMQKGINIIGGKKVVVK